MLSKPLAPLASALACTFALAFTLAGCATPAAPARAPGSAAPAAPTPPTPPTPPTQRPRGIVRKGTPPGVNIAAAREQARERGFTWEPWGPATFERARREHRFILLDGAAEWCHWCHVMDETTYLDPEIGRILKERFLAIRVDIDERPDLGERYGEWGWPATILFSPDAEEIGKYRGYIPPEELKVILAEVEAQAKSAAVSVSTGARELPAPPGALGWIGAMLTAKLDDYYDPEQGSWGERQKSALGANVEFELSRAAHGDSAARERALFTLGKHRALIDPVWGGVYQYSAAANWNAPHYEKLMDVQTANLEAYARGYAATKDPAFLADAQRIAGYLSTFLSNKDGAFLVSQDADAGAHDKNALFVDGDVYYRLPDPKRRELGIPRVDDHVYAHENGIAICAFVTLYEAGRDAAILARARRAAELIQRTLVGPDGAVRRGTGDARYLFDAAGLGRALARLAEATGEPAYREAAIKIAAAMERDFADPTTGAFFAHTVDPKAAGVFARRDRPFVPNVLAARFLAALGRVTGEASYRERGRRALAGVFTPNAIAARGRMVGETLLALSEVEAYPWRGPGPAEGR